MSIKGPIVCKHAQVSMIDATEVKSSTSIFNTNNYIISKYCTFFNAKTRILNLIINFEQANTLILS